MSLVHEEPLEFLIRRTYHTYGCILEKAQNSRQREFLYSTVVS